MSMTQELSEPVYALLADGTTVEIRPAVPDDFDAPLPESFLLRPLPVDR